MLSLESVAVSIWKPVVGEQKWWRAMVLSSAYGVVKGRSLWETVCWTRWAFFLIMPGPFLPHWLAFYLPHHFLQLWLTKTNTIHNRWAPEMGSFLPPVLCCFPFFSPDGTAGESRGNSHGGRKWAGGERHWYVWNRVECANTLDCQLNLEGWLAERLKKNDTLRVFTPCFFVTLTGCHTHASHMMSQHNLLKRRGASS